MINQQLSHSFIYTAIYKNYVVDRAEFRNVTTPQPTAERSRTTSQTDVCNPLNRALILKNQIFPVLSREKRRSQRLHVPARRGAAI